MKNIEELQKAKINQDVYGRLIVVASMLILYGTLTALYSNVVATRYSFGGFIYNPRASTWSELCIVIVGSLFLPTSPKKMSQVFSWISMIFLLVPAAVLSAREGSDRSTLFSLFGGVALVMVLCAVYDRLEIVKGLSTKAGNVTVRIVPIFIIISLILIALAVHVDGALNFSLADVYEYRFDFNKSLDFPLNYLLPFAGGPLVGLATATALYKKNYIVIGLVLFIGALFFGFSSHKAFMFYPGFVIISYFLIRVDFGFVALAGIFIVLSLTSLFLVDGVNNDLLGSSFANRLVFIPAQIHYFFFTQFGDIGYQYWAESRFGFGIHKSDIPLSSVNYIGLIMTGDAEIGANTGWLANGYMNAGGVGIGIYAVILSATLHFIDKLGERFGYAFVGAAFIIPISNIVNSIDLLAAFLTGGLILLFVCFFLSVKGAAASAAPIAEHD